MFSKTYCIIYHTNCDLKIDNVEIKAKKPMPALKELSREGYKFLGWYLDSEFTQEYNLEKMPKHDVEVYAKWEAISLEEFLNDINFFTKSANILKNLQNDYDGVIDFKDPKNEEEKPKVKKKTTKKKTSTKKTVRKKTVKKAKIEKLEEEKPEEQAVVEQEEEKE